MSKGLAGKRGTFAMSLLCFTAALIEKLHGGLFEQIICFNSFSTCDKINRSSVQLGNFVASVQKNSLRRMHNLPFHQVWQLTSFSTHLTIWKLTCIFWYHTVMAIICTSAPCLDAWSFILCLTACVPSDTHWTGLWPCSFEWPSSHMSFPHTPCPKRYTIQEMRQIFKLNSNAFSITITADKWSCHSTFSLWPGNGPGLKICRQGVSLFAVKRPLMVILNGSNYCYGACTHYT